jgi:hypothetical protein
MGFGALLDIQMMMFLQQILRKRSKDLPSNQAFLTAKQDKSHVLNNMNSPKLSKRACNWQNAAEQQTKRQ